MGAEARKFIPRRTRRAGALVSLAATGALALTGCSPTEAASQQQDRPATTSTSANAVEPTGKTRQTLDCRPLQGLLSEPQTVHFGSQPLILLGNPDVGAVVFVGSNPENPPQLEVTTPEGERTVSNRAADPESASMVVLNGGQELSLGSDQPVEAEVTCASTEDNPEDDNQTTVLQGVAIGAVQEGLRTGSVDAVTIATDGLLDEDPNTQSTYDENNRGIIRQVPLPVAS